MQHTSVAYRSGFHVLIGDGRSQAASMVIAPGEREGGPDNRHGGADQWLYVVDGAGEAIVNGETHAIYVPPAYASDGDELAAGKP